MIFFESWIVNPVFLWPYQIVKDVQTHTTLLAILVPVKVISKAYKSVSYMDYNSKSHPRGIDNMYSNFAD